MLGVAAVGHTFAAGHPGMGVDLFAFVTFASSEFVNRDFGITAEQSENSGLPETSLDVGRNKRDSAWIMARTPTISREDFFEEAMPCN